MSEYKGIVEEADSRDWKNGLKLYYFKLEGSAVTHHCGNQDPGVEVGDTIKFKEVSRKVLVNSIEKISLDEARAAPSAEHPKAETSQSVTSSAPADVGERIRRQAARHDAVLLVTTAMETKLLPYSLGGKGEDKWARMLDLIDDTTNDLLEQEDKKWKTRSE